MRLIDKIALGLLLAGVLISTGCGSDKYPNELSLEDAPETIAEAFKDEKNANIKSMATRATQLLKARNYTVAHGVLKQLMPLPDLTPEQRDLIAGGMMAGAENLNKAAEQGNAQAGRYLKQQSFGK
jgi:phosphoserine phosphatase